MIFNAETHQKQRVVINFVINAINFDRGLLLKDTTLKEDKIQPV